MADETQPTVTNEVPDTLEISRNKTQENAEGNPWTFSKQKLKKKDKSKPDKFALVPIRPKTPEDFNKWLEFLGIQQAAIASYQRVRGMSANWTESSTNDSTGQFVLNDFVKCVEEMSARGETLKDLNNERNELTNEIIALSKDHKLNAVDKVKRMEEIASRLNEINDVIAARQAKAQEDAELEDASPAQ